MTPLSDSDLQALLSGDLDPSDLSGRLDPTTQAALDAYREVWAALEMEPAPFAPGFADRVVGAVEVERRAASAPRRSLAAPAVTALGAVLLLVFQAPLTQAFAGLAPVDALPWVAFGLLTLGLAEGLDRVVRRRASGL
ncbi:hypothetical protein [Rubrivirga sp.]|uniref:hypothetical protein n=1 Tax=Rubrivirga sp. TaxID=1885344 RepID=UPI003B51BDE6